MMADERTEVAQRVHEAMVWATEQPGPAQDWQGGNSIAEEKARRIADRILAATRPAPKADSALVGELPDGRNYLIRKGPYWYRPQARGYTGNPHEAGRFTESDAREYSHPNGPDGPRDGIRYFHISEVDWPPLAALSDRDVVLEEAAKVAENEKVDAENSDDVMSDRAYNAACEHAAQAIRALKGGVDGRPRKPLEECTREEVDAQLEALDAANPQPE